MSRMDEIIVDIELIDEIVVDVLQDDEVSVSIEDADEVEVKAFDYPPDIDRLNQEVIAVKEDSATAVDLATQATQTASQAAQSAQEAETIAEGAATSAGEAVQAVNTHVQTKTNPHPTNITQEFSEVKVSMLKDETSGGGVDDAQWAWLNIPPAEKTSVFSVLRAMLAKIYASLLFYAPIPAKEFAGEIALDKDYTPYNSWTPTTSIPLTVAQGSRVGGTADGIMVLTNVNLAPSLANLSVWPLSQDIDSTGTWSWMAWRNSSGTFISFTKIA